MFVYLPGWARHIEGNVVRLVAPEGEPAGVITVEERVRSLTSIADLLCDRRVVAGPTLMTNGEGEQGVLVTVEELSESGRRYEIGMLVGDEFNAVVTGATLDPDHFDRTRQAVKVMVGDLPLFLGVRRRLFLYPPPVGWHGIRRGLVTTWHAPRYPAELTRLIVHPALPRKSMSSDELHRTLCGEICGSADVGQVWTDELVTTRFGMSFRVSSTSISNTVVRLAIGEDNSYVYALWVEAENIGDLGALIPSLDGVVPIDLRQAPNLMYHWAT